MSRTQSPRQPRPHQSGVNPDQTPSESAARSASQPNASSRTGGRIADHRWLILLIIITVVVALRLGALDWYTGDTVGTADGTTERLPNTFASIDHPFHISKEQAVLDALRDGEMPRWFANHQAGYPAEFYPLGADFIVAAGWVLGLGLVPLEVVHKLIVIAVLFIPAIAFWLIGRRDGLPASVAIIATLLHLFIPGSWMAGGTDELLRMGMWPNVFAAYLTLPLLLSASPYLRNGKPIGLAISAGIGSLAIYTNPRATISIGTILLAIVVVTAIDRLARKDEGSHPWQLGWRDDWTRLLLLRAGVVAASIALLSAALLVPLRARQQDYEFTRFVEFDRPGKLTEYLGGAMPLEIVALGLIGVALAWRTTGFYSRVAALWLPLGLGVVLIAGWALRDLSVFAQLEGPRLIPILRLPLLLLAAITIHRAVTSVVTRLREETAPNLAGIIAVALTAAFVLTPVSTLSDAERGLPHIDTTDQAAFTSIATSAEAYALISTPEDRALIAGSPLSDHASFWIPALTDANAFHTAWIWYWKTPAFADRTRITDINAALDPGFLDRHALTYVLIATDDADLMNAAIGRDYLEQVGSPVPGGYTIFHVIDDDPATDGPVSVVDGEVLSVDASREQLHTVVRALQPTEIRVAINDYPAWSATVNGSETSIRRDADGYMLIDVPAGDAAVTLTYAVKPVVWLGRTLTALGILVVFTTVVIERRRAMRTTASS